jgi:endonuclease/exonuclease/phosphatase family metal-dependent hydrolase
MSERKPLNVLTFNIHKGLNATSRRLILSDIRTLFLELNPDIIFLQEVQGEHKKRQVKFTRWPVETHLKFLAGDEWPYHCYGGNHQHRHGHHGNAILSKFPLLEMNNIDISASRFSNRGVLHAQCAHPDVENPIHVLCTHFGFLKREQQRQFEKLNRYIDKNIGVDDRLILAGDFNDWKSKSKILLSSALNVTEAHRLIHGDYAKTFPAKVPLLKVDRIYSRNLIVQGASVIRSKNLSDHLPLWARYNLYL